MISFRQYISEEEAKANMPLLTHVMSGPYGKKTMEHAHHALIPTTTTRDGSSNKNLWISHIEHPNDTHELHFAISSHVTPQKFNETKEKMLGPKIRAPSDVFYSIPGEESKQMSIENHGPSTMIHVMRHMGTMLERIPKGHRIVIHTGSTNEKDGKRKTSAYRAMAGRAERHGMVRILASKKKKNSFAMERL